MIRKWYTKHKKTSNRVAFSKPFAQFLYANAPLIAFLVALKGMDISCYLSFVLFQPADATALAFKLLNSLLANLGAYAEQLHQRCKHTLLI